jgi:hypothetical protein
MNCTITSKKLCGQPECSTCYNRSFAIHPKSIYWSSKNNVKSYQVLKNSNKKYLFDCIDCGHELEMGVKMYLLVNGVNTVIEMDYVYQMNVNSVTINHLHLILWLLIGLIKMILIQ